MTSLDFGSVCSGIEAASVAWNPLGWKTAWLSEIEPFPCAVLAHHYPSVPNHGDMTTLVRRILCGEVTAPDVFTGGTPCQAFSVAGKRRSLDDARGNLSLTFVDIADAIDHVRAARGDDECVIVWENVPGVLSTRDNAFGCFLGALAGSGCELQPPGGGPKWDDAGCIYGPARTVAWRVLDAQYFGLAQRRRRVFVVASARDGFDPVAVLFEREGLRRDFAPSREAREVAPTLPSRSTGGGGLGTDFDLDGGVGVWPADVACTLNPSFGDKQGLEDQHINGGGRCLSLPAVSMCLTVGGQNRQDAESETLIPTIGGGFDDAWSIRTANTSSNGWDIQHEVTHTLDQAQGLAIAHTLKGEGFDASEDGTGRGTPQVPCFAIQAGALRTNPESGPDGVGIQSDFAYTLEARAEVQCVAFGCKDSDPVRGVSNDISPTLRAMGHANSNANAGGQVAVAVALRGRASGATAEVGDEVGNALRASQGGGDKPHVLTGMAVRRLTPRECERLQGFPDDYTRIPSWSGWRKLDESETPEQLMEEGIEVRQNKKTGRWRVKDVDGPRYKAIGNSWAITPVRWLGARIHAQLAGGDQ